MIVMGGHKKPPPEGRSRSPPQSHRQHRQEAEKTALGSVVASVPKVISLGRLQFPGCRGGCQPPEQHVLQGEFAGCLAAAKSSYTFKDVVQAAQRRKAERSLLGMRNFGALTQRFHDLMFCFQNFAVFSCIAFHLDEPCRISREPRRKFGSFCRSCICKSVRFNQALLAQVTNPGVGGSPRNCKRAKAPRPQILMVMSKPHA